MQFPTEDTLQSHWLISRLSQFEEKIAITGKEESITYSRLKMRAMEVAGLLQEKLPDAAAGSRVCLLFQPGLEMVSALLGCWAAGFCAVPLSTAYPPDALHYFIEDSQASLVMAQDDFFDLAQHSAMASGVNAISISAHSSGILKIHPSKSPALILYTSGTTGKPKGVLLSHKNLFAQTTTLVKAWEWKSNDSILHVLPLHHTHGLVNALLCPLFSGARVQFSNGFDPVKAWNEFANVSLFMGVPTLYNRAIKAWEDAEKEKQLEWSSNAKNIRLFVSGSAALPASVFQRWQVITGHEILERYGMTETGMILSNPLHSKRIAGTVGAPLPGVYVQLKESEMGMEIQVKGDSVFSAYWNRPEPTRESFGDGWFRTGDIAVVENGVYRLLGRSSTDIIKSGGYKISAVEIEDVFRDHPDITDISVVGLPDADWGERVCAGIILKPDAGFTTHQLREWAKQFLPAYKIPGAFFKLDSFPRNQLGKVEKKKLREILERLLTL